MSDNADQVRSSQLDTLLSVDAKLPADSVEWVPLNGYRHISLCGTYKLQQAKCVQEQQPGLENITDQSAVSSCSREGTILPCCLYFENAGDDGKNNLHYFVGSHVNVTSAVLDIKFCPYFVKDQPMFGIATAEGSVQIWSLNTDTDNPDIVILSHKRTEPLLAADTGENLALSLDWLKHDRAGALCASDSQGCLSLYEWREGSLHRQHHWKAHSLEAWTTSSCLHQPHVLYSGGDDSLLKVWDSRQLDRPTAVLKSHTAGVCSIQSHPKNPSVFVSGSYDEHLRVWDNRQLSRPLSELPLGGGMWRIKWDEWQSRWLAVACMYGGCVLVDMATLESPSIAANYIHHQSIAYGIDYCPLLPKDLPLPPSHYSTDGASVLQASLDQRQVAMPLIASCSFYDAQLHLWSSNITL